MTNQLNDRERELVALGAAMGSNCVGCIEHHVPAARQAGLTDAQISEALQIADQVRQVPARKALDAGTRLLPGASACADRKDNGADEGPTRRSMRQACCG